MAEQKTAEISRGGKQRKGSGAREAIESILVAVIAALLIRKFVFEIFRIPTSSMEPTLVGEEHYGDRVICSKLSYGSFFGTPKRWQIVVFVFRHGEGKPKDFIKRVIGLPGERVEIISGDIYIDGKIARKAPHVQDAVWHTLYDDDLSTRWRDDNPSWLTVDSIGPEAQQGTPVVEAAAEPESARGCWLHDPASGVLLSPAQGKSYIRYSRRPTNLYVKNITRRFKCPHCSATFKATISTIHTVRECPACGKRIDFLSEGLIRHGRKTERYPRVPEREVDVGDLKLTVAFVPKGNSGALLLVVERDGKPFVLTLPLSETPASLVGPWGVNEKAELPPLESDLEHVVSLAHVDRAVEAHLDGTLLVRKEYPPPPALEVASIASGKCYVGWEADEAPGGGPGVILTRLRIDRDLHYLAPPIPGEKSTAMRTGYFRFDVPIGQYCMFGDNSPSSHDSRFWYGVDSDDIVGRALVVFWPPTRFQWVR